MFNLSWPALINGVNLSLPATYEATSLGIDRTLFFFSSATLIATIQHREHIAKNLDKHIALLWLSEKSLSAKQPSRMVAWSLRMAWADGIHMNGVWERETSSVESIPATEAQELSSFTAEHTKCHKRHATSHCKWCERWSTQSSHTKMQLTWGHLEVNQLIGMVLTYIMATPCHVFR